MSNYCWNGYRFYVITEILGSKCMGLPWGWGPGLQYYCGYGVGFFSRTCNFVKCIIDFIARQVVCASLNCHLNFLFDRMFYKVQTLLMWSFCLHQGWKKSWFKKIKYQIFSLNEIFWFFSKKYSYFRDFQFILCCISTVWTKWMADIAYCFRSVGKPFGWLI